MNSYEHWKTMDLHIKNFLVSNLHDNAIIKRPLCKEEMTMNLKKIGRTLLNIYRSNVKVNTLAGF